MNNNTAIPYLSSKWSQSNFRDDIIEDQDGIFIARNMVVFPQEGLHADKEAFDFKARLISAAPAMFRLILQRFVDEGYQKDVNIIYQIMGKEMSYDDCIILNNQINGLQ